VIEVILCIDPQREFGPNRNAAPAFTTPVRKVVPLICK